MDISLQGGGSAPALLGTRRADTPATKTTTADDFASVPQQNQLGAFDSIEQKRFEKIRAASADFFKDFYPLGDKTFTIYKDTSGQYVTRYTSLRDGKVTYYPESDLLRRNSNPELLPQEVIRIKV
jgi:hypothetical protein